MGADMTERTDREGLAIDHALGLTEGAERERAERLLATDAAFAAEVEAWRAALAPLDATAPLRTPAPALWQRIEAGLAPAPPSPAAAPRRTVRSLPLWERLDFWRPFGLAAAAVAIALFIGLSALLQRGPTEPALVAVLETDEGRPGAVVHVYPSGLVRLIPIERIGVPEGRILEVWTLQDRAVGPISVGRMDRARTLQLDLSRTGRPAPGHLFEITVEPPGGSPIGRPTGPILMKGLANPTL